MTIESPEGKKVIVSPINSFPPSEYEAVDTQYIEWSCHVMNKALELEELDTFFSLGWSPTLFFKALSAKGYKISWEQV